MVCHFRSCIIVSYFLEDIHGTCSTVNQSKYNSKFLCSFFLTYVDSTALETVVGTVISAILCDIVYGPINIIASTAELSAAPYFNRN
jgi:hypothetical protein